MFKRLFNGNTIRAMKNKITSRTKKTIAIIAASVTGLGFLTSGAALIAFDASFPRYERPDYSLYPGEYHYSRVSRRLDRSELYFDVGNYRLKGYYYPSQQSKGLVVTVHGFHSGADDYIPIIEYMVRAGYDVFAYDSTGTYDSEGESNVGLCQALIDIDNVLTYLDGAYPNKNKYLIGHSLGGYAAASVLGLKKHPDIKSCALIAPMNDGYSMIYDMAEQYAGKIVLAQKPIIDIYQSILFGDYTKYDGVSGINSTDIPILIAQGLTDTVITYDGLSITAHKNEITNKNVVYYDGTGSHGDHNNIWHSAESARYQQQVRAELDALKKQKQELGQELSKKELEEFYKGVDHALYSQVNAELMDSIISMFNSTL